LSYRHCEISDFTFLIEHRSCRSCF